MELQRRGYQGREGYILVHSTLVNRPICAADLSHIFGTRRSASATLAQAQHFLDPAQDKMKINPKPWEDISKEMIQHREDTFAKVEPPIPDVPFELPLNVTGLPKQLLSEAVTSITELPTETLLSRLASGDLSSVGVAKAFLQRAGLASKLTNCITELLPERAIARAQELDDRLARTGKPVGGLHGLPISVKEHIGMKGLDLNAGFVSWVGNLSPDEAQILKLLRKAGAVFYARTTEPQTLMHLECSNNIYGVTVNPYNTKLTSGGSSGGEGALLGLKGSCLGIGTDIGGSIRSPSANNGVFGLRPTTYRLPVNGWAATMFGEEQIVPVIGPMSTSIEGVKVFMRALLDQKPWMLDPSLVNIAWKTDNQLRIGAGGKRKLRVGVISDDGIVKPHPPIQRGLSTVISTLRSSPDVEVVDFPPYKHDEAWNIIASLYFGDGGREEIEAIDASGEPWRPLSKLIIKDNPFVKPDGLTVKELWDVTMQREGYRAAYARHWNSVNTGLPGPEKDENDLPEPLTDGVEDNMVDVILAPVGPGCAPPLDCGRYWGYTAQWNLLDYPALVFPTGLQCSAEDKVEEGYEPRNEQDKYNYELCELKPWRPCDGIYHLLMYRRTDEPERYVDAPISLQLIGRRYEDEKVVQAFEMLAEAAKLPLSV